MTGYVVARIGKAHGLRGEVTVTVHTDDPDGRFVIGSTFATQAAPGSGVPKALTIHTARNHNGTWLLSFDGIPDRTGAESLRGTTLLVDSAPLPGADDADPDQSEDNAWYADDLVGLTAYDTRGLVIGTVSGVQHAPAQDLLLIDKTTGGTAYIPFVEVMVPVVDVVAGRVVIDPPEGLLDLND